MKVKDVIEFLKSQDPEAEFVFTNSLIFGGCQTSNEYRLLPGYYVTNFVNEPRGIFVDSQYAVKIQEDGLPLLDLTSETIVPAGVV